MQQPRPTATLIPRRFEQCAAAWPGQAAVEHGSETVSYQTLDRRANALAHALVAVDGPEGPVALFLEHSAVLITAILGTLKAGRAYLYLDPRDPDARLRELVTDATPVALLTSRSLQPRAPAGLSCPLLLSEDFGEEAGPPVVACSPEAACALVYTSGSQGEPRGVLRSHRAVLHNIDNYSAALGLGPSDRLSLVSSASFGSAQTAIFGALLNGACLLPFDVREAGVQALASWLRLQRISVFHAVPTLFRHVAERLQSPLPALRWVKLGGEPAYRSDLELFRRRFGDNCRLLNGLGMTEAAGNICYFFADPVWTGQGHALPIGRAVPGRSVELLDEQGRPVAAGEVGEITVTSRYLASGYWRRPLLSRRTFPQVPGDPQARRLATGDLGRRAADGLLYHAGRKDRQLSLRGYRIELGAIEAALREHPQVRHAVVELTDHHGSPQLTAFLVGDRRLQRAQLRAFLVERLPSASVPSRWQLLEALPLLAHGKVDRAALRAMDPSPGGEVLPEVSGTLRLQMQQIFEDLLGLRKVPLDVDFFSLGGDSLRATRLLDRIEAAFGIALPAQALFTQSSVEHLVRMIQRSARRAASSGPAVFHADGSAPPLVFLHGDVRDGGFYCRDLARHLGGDQPLIVLPPLDSQELPSVEQRARAQRKLLRSAFPRGPYCIAGFCLSGLVAFELACQLSDAGETVPALAVIDCSPALPLLRTTWSAVARSAELLGVPRPALLRLFRTARRQLNAGPPLRSRGRLGVSPSALLRLLQRTIRLPRRLRAESAAQPPDPMVPFHWARSHYQPRPFPGPLTLILADKWAAHREEHRRRWQPWVRDVECHELPGRHHEGVTRHVGLLAAVLRAAMAPTVRGRPPTPG